MKPIFFLMLIIALLSASDILSADYALSKTEQAVLAEINAARTNPANYAKKYIEPLSKTSKNSSYRAAAKECASQMKAMKARQALKTSKGLAKAAKLWVSQQGPTGKTGHSSSWAKRIKQYGSCSGYAENISYGPSTGRAIVIQLLVDNGVPSRGHRKNILSASYTHVGCGVGRHTRYGTMCVIDFARNYRDK